MKYNLLSPEHIDETYNNIRNKIHNLTTEIVKKAWKKERLLDEIRAFYAHIILSGVIENFKKQKNLEKLFEVKYRNLELEYNNKSKSRKKNQGAHDTVKEALFKFNFGLGVDRNFPENCESYNYDVLFVSMMKLMSIYKIYTYNSGNTARGCINIIKINDKLFQLNFEYSNRNKTKFSFIFKKTEDKIKFMNSIEFMEIPKNVYTRDTSGIGGSQLRPPDILSIREAIAAVLRSFENFVESPEWGTIKKYS